MEEFAATGKLEIQSVTRPNKYPMIITNRISYWYWLKIVSMFFNYSLVFQLVNDSFTVLYTSVKWIIKPIYLCLCALKYFYFPLSIFVFVLNYVARVWNATIEYIDIGSFNFLMCEKPNNYNLNSNFESFMYLRLHFVMGGSNE